MSFVAMRSTKARTCPHDFQARASLGEGGEEIALGRLREGRHSIFTYKDAVGGPVEHLSLQRDQRPRVRRPGARRVVGGSEC